MKRSVSPSFYKREAWVQVRKAYLKKKKYLCERCGEPAVIVHHKIHLNEDNIKDDMLCYGEDNLEALCRKCHNEEHKTIYRMNKAHKNKKNNFKRRIIYGADGSVSPL